MKRYFLPLLLFVSISLHGQTIEVGLYGGASYYEGDLAPNKLSLYFKTLRPAYGGLVRFNINRWFSIRLGYTHMSVMGDDALSNRKKRTLSFETDIDEILIGGDVNLFRIYPFGGRIYVEPYLMGGFGVFTFNPTTEFEGEIIELQPLGTEAQGLPKYPSKYDLTQWNIAAGGGLKVRVAERWLLTFEFSGRMYLMDYLDDVSGDKVKYLDVLEGNGPLAAKLSWPTFDPEKDKMTKIYSRGGPARDYSATGGVTVSYLFGPDISGVGGRNSIKCPKF